MYYCQGIVTVLANMTTLFSWATYCNFKTVWGSHLELLKWSVSLDKDKWCQDILDKESRPLVQSNKIPCCILKWWFNNSNKTCKMCNKVMRIQDKVLLSHNLCSHCGPGKLMALMTSSPWILSIIGCPLLRLRASSSTGASYQFRMTFRIFGITEISLLTNNLSYLRILI